MVRARMRRAGTHRGVAVLDREGVFMSSSQCVEKRCSSCLRVIAPADDYCSRICREADETYLQQRQVAAPVVELAKLRDDNVVMARERAHAVFDLLELLGFMTRDEAYHWLGSKLHLEKREAHIGRLNPEQCERLVALAREQLKRNVAALRSVAAAIQTQVAAKESA